MKLHLPKMLLTAVLAACSTAYAFGPQEVVEGVMTDVGYTEITGVTNGEQSPEVNTYYSNVENSGGTISITTPAGKDKVHIKLGIEGENKYDKEADLGTISAASTWIAEGRFNLDSANDVAAAGDLYVNGGALHIGVDADTTIGNNITLGTSTYASDSWSAYSALNSAALIIGHHNKTNKDVTFSGNLTIADNAKICMQSGYDLNLTGKLIGSANLEFSRYSNNGNTNSIITFSGSAAGYTGNITINGFEQDNTVYTNTLKLTGTGTNLLTNAASITMGEKAKLDVELSADVFRNIESKVQATEADGFINIVTNHDSDTEVKFSSTSNEDVNLTKKYNLDGHLSVHAGGQNAAVRIKGGTVNVTQDVNLIAGGKLMIEGGVLSSRYVTLGHPTAGDHPGHLIMTSGALKTGAIKLIQSGRNNTVSIEGGILEFTEADALVKQVGDYAKNTESTISIVGASTDTPVTLKANTTNWKIDGSGLTTLPSIGNVQVDSGNTHSITFEHVQLTGSIINNKLLSLGREVTVAEGATASLSGTGTTTIEGTLSISGSLSVGGTIQIAADFAGNYEDAGSAAVRTGNLSHGSNGFEEYTGYSSWYLVKHKEGANVSSSLAGATLADATYTLTEVDDGIVIRTVGDSYYDYQLGFTVNTGTVDVAALLVDSGSHVTADTKYVLKGGVLAVKSGTFNANNVVTDSNDGGTINVENGATLTNANNVAAITAGSGTIELSYDTSYNSVPNAGADFTGTTHIKEGRFTINGASFGNKLILDDGVNFQLSAGSTVTLAPDKQLVLNGTSEVHQNTNQSTGKGADFTVNGVVSGNGTYDRRGGGTLTFNNSVTLGAFSQTICTGTSVFNGNLTLTGNLTAKQGTIEIGEGTHSVNELDVSKGNTSTATVRLKSGAQLTSQSKLWLHTGDAKILLEDTASLTRDQLKVSGTSHTDGTSITRVTGEDGGDEYSLGNTSYVMKNAKVEVATAEGGATISNRLINVALTNTGTGTLVASNGYNTYTELVAKAGNLDIRNFGTDTGKNGQGNLELLEIAAGKTIGVHTPYNSSIDDASGKATIAVSGAATFGKNATLNANLTLNDSVTLTLGEGGLNMNNSVLTLGSSLTLNQETVQRIMELAEGKVALFTNVSELILGEQHYTAGSLTADNGVALSEVFSQENMPTELTAAANTSYYLGFDGNGMVYAAQIVPEPTTATLSLLALAALAARRRRR